MINGIKLVLIFSLCAPGEVGPRAPNKISDIRNGKIVWDVRTTLVSFSVGQNPRLEGNFVLDGSTLRFF